MERAGNAALRALTADYAAQSCTHDQVTLTTSVVRSDLEQLSASEYEG